MSRGIEGEIRRVLRESPPCEGCIFRDVCGKREWACQDFYEYVKLGVVLFERRVPSRRIFRKVMRLNG